MCTALRRSRCCTTRGRVGGVSGPCRGRRPPGSNGRGRGGHGRSRGSPWRGRTASARPSRRRWTAASHDGRRWAGPSLGPQSLKKISTPSRVVMVLHADSLVGGGATLNPWQGWHERLKTPALGSPRQPISARHRSQRVARQAADARPLPPASPAGRSPGGSRRWQAHRVGRRIRVKDYGKAMSRLPIFLQLATARPDKPGICAALMRQRGANLASNAGIHRPRQKCVPS